MARFEIMPIDKAKALFGLNGRSIKSVNREKISDLPASKQPIALAPLNCKPSYGIAYNASIVISSEYGDQSAYAAWLQNQNGSLRKPGMKMDDQASILASAVTSTNAKPITPLEWATLALARRSANREMVANGRNWHVSSTELEQIVPERTPPRRKHERRNSQLNGNSINSHNEADTEKGAVMSTQHNERKKNSPDVLNEREQQIFNLFALGFSTNEVASKMGVSVKTIHLLRSTIIGKLEAHTMTEAVLKGIQRGNITLEVNAEEANKLLSLSRGERNVLDVIVENNGVNSTNEEVAEVIGIGDKSVCSYISTMLRKTGNKSRVLLTAQYSVAKQLGILDRELTENSPTVSNKLTQRERDILDLVARGYDAKDIAKRMQISPSTVKKHRSTIIGKLDSSSSTEAVLKGLQTDQISIEINEDIAIRFRSLPRSKRQILDALIADNGSNSGNLLYDMLGYSAAAVKNHISILMQIMGCKNRVELVTQYALVRKSGKVQDISIQDTLPVNEQKTTQELATSGMLSLGEAAKVLGVSRPTFSKYIHQGRLHPQQASGDLRQKFVSQAEITQLLQSKAEQNRPKQKTKRNLPKRVRSVSSKKRNTADVKDPYGLNLLPEEEVNESTARRILPVKEKKNLEPLEREQEDLLAFIRSMPEIPNSSRRDVLSSLEKGEPIQAVLQRAKDVILATIRRQLQKDGIKAGAQLSIQFSPKNPNTEAYFSVPVIMTWWTNPINTNVSNRDIERGLADRQEKGARAFYAKHEDRRVYQQELARTRTVFDSKSSLSAAS